MQNNMRKDMQKQHKKQYTISASILSADFARLGEEVTNILHAGADVIHFDVMDNHYVPNLTIGPLVCSALRKYGITAHIDVHLMVQPVDTLITEFANAGANAITFHPEASLHVDRSLQLIKTHGCQAGLALNPATSLDCLEYLWDKLDLILVMSVNPGFGGQKFIPSSLKKIAQLKQLLAQNNSEAIIAVDGGINAETINSVAQAGATTFIMGSALFGNKNYSENIKNIKANLPEL